MNPSSSQLITAIADALRTRIAPLLADQAWPCSELRSIDALLAHLAARVEHEHAVLLEDNADLDAVLDDLADAGVGVDVVAPEPQTIGALHAGNVARRAALESAIHRIHDGTHQQQVDLVRSYLVRAAERDQLIFGSFGGRALF